MNGEAKIESFLIHLAVDKDVSPSTGKIISICSGKPYTTHNLFSAYCSRGRWMAWP